ncbi:AAA family ATPase [Aquincola sp. S2]|uniref:AAA family ATPase n=1 Tax=Pseudaquabacterium terrae TaxID=2732868 RepID=A0ABX2EKB0_9BURK|nr:AAA family ATPase [Aquabacterium terrae]
MKRAPRVIVFAGPNGAGKTTHAEPILRQLGISLFVNADYIARGLSGRDTAAVDFEAGRIMLRRLGQLAADEADFAFESTLSSRSFAAFLAALRQRGYRVSIFYFSLRDATLAVRRVRMRVRLGGHDVAVETVRRRFGRSLSNFFDLYIACADEWTVFDNSAAGISQLVASHNRGGTTVEDKLTWQRLHRQAARARNRR